MPTGGVCGLPVIRDLIERRIYDTNWQVEPLAVESVRSSYFDDTSIFPPGSIEYDCALLMRDIDHQWHGRSDMCCPQ